MDQLESALTILQACLDRRFTELKLKKQLFDDNGVSLKIVETLLYLRYDIRYYVICTNEQVRELWETIRENELFIDFLLALKAEFISRIGRVEAMRIAEQLSEGLSASGINEELIDSDTYARLPASLWIERSIKENDWLLVLFLLEMLPVTNIIRFTSELTAIEL